MTLANPCPALSKEDGIIAGSHLSRPMNFDPKIQLYETFHTESKIYLVMEYASRGDLLDFINSRSRKGVGIGEELAKNLFRQIAEGVAHCHRRNVVHRLDEELF